jgi:hypothetical protein
MLEGYIFYLPRKYLFINLNIHKVSIISIGKNEFNYLQLIWKHFKILSSCFIKHKYFTINLLPYQVASFFLLWWMWSHSIFILFSNTHDFHRFCVTIGHNFFVATIVNIFPRLTLRNYYQFQILAQEIEAFIALECQFANMEVVYKRT